MRKLSSLKAAARRRGLARAAVVALVAFLTLSGPADARRKSISRGIPGGGDWRPVSPLLEDAPDTNRPRSFLFTAGADGTAKISLSADAALAGEFGFRLDNVVVFDAAQLALASECATDATDVYLPGQEACWIRDLGGCYSNREVQVPLFDADAPPANVDFLETFETEDWLEVPVDWTLEGVCWDDGATPDCAPDCPPRGAPRVVASDSVVNGAFPQVCGFRVGTGGFLAFNDPNLPGCQPAPGTDPRASVLLSGLEPGVEYVVQVWWGSKVDMFADGSEILYVSGPPELLLVDDDDNAPDVRAAYTGPLDALAVPYEVWDTGNSDAEEPAAIELEDLDRVIWFSGGAFTDPPPGVAGPGAAGETALSSFLDAGGCLMLSAQDYIWDRERTLTPFMVDRLGVGGGAENVKQTWVAGTGPFAGAGAANLTYPFTNFSDRLDPGPSAAAAFDGDKSTAAVAKDDGTSRTAFLAFPLETAPAELRRQALARFFDWCRDPTLTVKRDGTGSGRVTGATAAIDCGADCTVAYRQNTQVALSAAPAAGSTFRRWSGGGCSGSGACVVAVATDVTVTATFDVAVPDRTLTVSRGGTGAGTVTSEPAGIACGSDCSESYPEGTVVTLTATPAAGSTFTGWGGACSGMSCSVTMNANRSVSASFAAAGGNDCAGALCLTGDRFQVDVEWRTAQGGVGDGKPVPFRSDDSGLLWFFNADNWEMLVKVLDGCGLNNHFWVFAAATTDVQYTLTVRDTQTGLVQEYFNPLGTAAASITDTAAFAVCDSRGAAPAEPAATAPVPAAPDPSAWQELGEKVDCVDGATNLCLNQSRFKVEVVWRTANGSGSGQVVPFGSDDSGLFYFFTANNWEMLVKVLNGCGLNNRYWVLAAATTDVGYTLKVTDTENGKVREHFNPVGRASPAIIDTDAFSTCP